MPIRLARGNRKDIPSLAFGQPGYCKDTEELWIGGESGNVNLSNFIKKSNGPHGGLHDLYLVDVDRYAVASRFGNSFWKFDLNSMIGERLIQYEAKPVYPSWTYGKLICRPNSDHDILIMPRGTQGGEGVYRFRTDEPFVPIVNGDYEQKIDNLRTRWLANTGFDVDKSSGVMIFAEYITYDTPNLQEFEELKVWRSSDWGETWSEVFSQNSREHISPDIYHFHVVRRDPYNSGHWYLSSGDADGECFLWRSEDDGLTWTDVSDTTNFYAGHSIHRMTNIYFTEDYMYWGLDDHIPEHGSAWCRVDRNLAGGNVLITPVADMLKYVRPLYKTPWGLLALTQSVPNNPTYGTDALAWMVPYEDLDNPVLVGRFPGYSFGMQHMEYSYGSKILMGLMSRSRNYYNEIDNPYMPRFSQYIISRNLDNSFSFAELPVYIDGRKDV